MTGPTHALGGVAAYCAVVTLTGSADHAPAWAFGVAALSGLIPDADNGRGSLLNRWYFQPLRLATLPLWYRAAHRGRTHSLLGVGAFALIAAFWAAVIAALAASGGGAFDARPWMTAAVAGYASHLLIDLLNLPGVLLLWPLPLRFFFPPWRWHGILPGRIPASDTWQERIIVFGSMAAYTVAFFSAHGSQVAAATGADSGITGLARGIGGLIGDLFRLIASAGSGAK